MKIFRLRLTRKTTNDSYDGHRDRRVYRETLSHEGNALREFYAGLESPVVVDIEASGAMQWFLELLEELGIECQVGHPAKIRAAEIRKQKHG
jgi:hypothetical protein